MTDETKTMSSPRRIHVSDAIIRSAQPQPSPILLPIEEDSKELFVQQFNQTYASIGWRIESVGGPILRGKNGDAGGVPIQK